MGKLYRVSLLNRSGNCGSGFFHSATQKEGKADLFQQKASNNLVCLFIFVTAVLVFKKYKSVAVLNSFFMKQVSTALRTYMCKTTLFLLLVQYERT